MPAALAGQMPMPAVTSPPTKTPDQRNDGADRQVDAGTARQDDQRLAEAEQPEDRNVLQQIGDGARLKEVGRQQAHRDEGHQPEADQQQEPRL